MRISTKKIYIITDSEECGQSKIENESSVTLSVGVHLEKCPTLLVKIIIQIESSSLF